MGAPAKQADFFRSDEAFHRSTAAKSHLSASCSTSTTSTESFGPALLSELIMPLPVFDPIVPEATTDLSNRARNK